MSESRIPAALAVRILHVMSNGTVHARTGILRALPQTEKGRAEVDLYLDAQIMHGNLHLHVILDESQSRDLLQMLREACTLVEACNA